MSIQVSCPNGHRIKAKDSLAGKRVKCPSCGEPISIPAASPPVGSPLPNSPATPRSAPKKKRKKASPNMPLIIGACAGAGILLFGLIVLAIVLLSGGDDSSVADQKASPDQEHATSSGSSDSPSNTESDSPAGRSAYSTERVPVAHRATYGMTPVDGPSIVTSDPPPAEPYTPPS